MAGQPVWTPPDLDGQVAVVTGASRGVGRGVAEVLGECGATVYLVARSAMSSASPGREGTLDEVAQGIVDKGGRAVPAPCDLNDDAAVDALFTRVGHEQGHLEILVNNAVGWSAPDEHEDTGAMEFMAQPPWRAPTWWWDANFAVGVRSHYVVTNRAAVLMIPGGRGAVFFTSERQPKEAGMQELVLDLRATVMARMALLFSLHFRPHGIASVLLYPGFTRTDAIEQAYRRGNDYFRGWTEEDFYSRIASIHYAGRATAVLAAEGNALEHTGAVVTSFDAATKYDFTDTSGQRPDTI